MVRDSFELLSKVIRTGELPSARLKQAYYNDTSVGARRVKYLTRNVVNTVIEAKSEQQRYSLQVIDASAKA